MANRFVYYHTRPELLKWASEKIGLGCDFENDPLARTVSYIQTEPDCTFTILAVVVLNFWSHTTVEASIATDGTRRWAKREFIKAVYERVFTHHGRLRMNMAVLTNNTAALNMHGKLGHVREGVMRDFQGEGQDAFLYGFTRKDYQQSRWL